MKNIINYLANDCRIDYDGIISKKVYKKAAENIRDKVFVHSSISVANHVYVHVKNYVKFGSK